MRETGREDEKKNKKRKDIYPVAGIKENEGMKH